ncbi:MAG: NAD(P)-binding domain-containing protein [Candidatus Omnitrophica bacterium]|nr:NAD(P)-binding domain-containing protein [Candidatus Omnitrophota bacterium]
MPDNELIEIRLSRVIPAEKWRVIRLLTKVWEFPQYVPCVEEVTLLKKERDSLITKWRIEIEKVPVSWIEKDTLALKEGAIYFKSIKGDLEEFFGEWLFESTDEGTRVSVNIHLKSSVPIIKDFALPHIKKIITRNFEAILEAMERRLISSRYQSFKTGSGKKIAGFGIVGHLYNFNHLGQVLKALNPDFKMPSIEFMHQLINITPSFKLYDILNFTSKSGEGINGCFVLATFIPDLIERDMWMICAKVIRACKIAEKHGVGIVSLGGFSSIAVEMLGEGVMNDVHVPVTTGNTFASAMVIDSVFRAAKLFNKDIASLKVAIVGGTGDIGSACARVLVNEAKQLTVTGRNKENLIRLRQELAKKHKSAIQVSLDNPSAVKDADIVICAANSSASILEAGWFKRGAIVCDAGYPRNVRIDALSRDDIFIFSGGLVKSPVPFEPLVSLGLPAKDVIFGDFAEAIILSLERRYENYSQGKGNILPEKIDEIRKMGKSHGFEASDFYCGDKLVDRSIIEKVKEASN